jgi:MtN3 and saliva related transmembrane protein
MTGETLANLVGSAAALLTTGSWLPQVVKTWRSRSAHDFSWSYLAMFSTGVTLWLVYGWMRDDPVIVAANGLTVLLVLTIAVVKLRNPGR